MPSTPQAPDYFSDILGPGEQVVATLGGPGPTLERASGPERIWYQLGLTQGRILVVKLVQSALTGTYAPQARVAVGKEFIRVRRFPRTPASSAHLEILGAGEPIQVLDIDDEKIFPYVEPFLTAWGGNVEGAGLVVARAADPYATPEGVEGMKVLYAIIAVVVIGWSCACCSGLGLAVKGWILPMME